MTWGARSSVEGCKELFMKILTSQKRDANYSGYGFEWIAFHPTKAKSSILFTIYAFCAHS